MENQNDPPRVANPPAERPVMVFDGDCGFCRYWVERWRHVTGGKVDYEPSSEAAARYPEIPRDTFDKAIQFIETDGHVTSGADAVFKALEYAPEKNRVLEFLKDSPGFRETAGFIYGVVAGNRAFFSRLTRLSFGRSVHRPTYFVARWVFMRLLGAIFLVAFLSLLMQLAGLAGSHGIVPAADFLQGVKGQTGNERYWLVPTIFWFDASDQFLKAMCVTGITLSCAVILDLLPSLCLFLLWTIYLSFVSVCAPFLDFQWDILLLEVGFLAIFLVPPALRPSRKTESGGSRLARWLLLWLLFCLMFESGVVKLTSGDDCWKDFTALTYHYQTQPLPIWTSWYMNQEPLWFETLSVMFMFAVELAAPFCIFGPRNLRCVGCALMVLLQILIAATGNYCFFNLLTVALCLLLLDDDVWPRRFREKLLRGSTDSPTRRWGWPVQIVAPIAVLDIFLSVIQLAHSFNPRLVLSYDMAWVEQRVQPFDTFNSYGLFRVMTRTRNEIVIEGSNDGEQWLPYEFKWKPGDVNRRPGLVAPFQPRLDWQMWFAALGGFRDEWFIRFLVKVKEGSPEVLGLLASNPFPDTPPRYLRATVYRYEFTTSDDHTRAWWKRKLLGTLITLAPKSSPAE